MQSKIPGKIPAKILGKAVGAGATAIVAAFIATTCSAADNEVFLQDAIQGSIAEVKLGQLAQQNAGSEGVRSFGSRLVTDHSAAKDQASALAKSMNVSVPTEPKPDAQREYDRLQPLTGAAFDKEFIQHMVQDHETDIQKFEEQAKEDDDQVAQFANATLPTLKEHLGIAQKIEAQGH